MKTLLSSFPNTFEHHPRALWLSAVSIAVLSYGTLAWFGGTSALPFARSAEAELNEITRLSSEVQNEDTEALDKTGSIVGTLAAEIATITQPNIWIRSLSPAISWLPGADLELRAWTAQVERIVKDVKTAETLTSLSIQLLSSYKDAEEALRNPVTGTVNRNTVNTGDLDSSFSTAARTLQEARRLKDRHMPILTIRFFPVMDSVDHVESQMITVAAQGEQASLLLNELTRVSEEAGPLVRQFLGGSDNVPLTVDSLVETVADLDTNLQFALVEADLFYQQLSDDETSASLKQRVGNLNEVLTVLLLINRAVSISLSILEPALTETDGSQTAMLGSDGILVETLKNIADGDSRIADAVSQLNEATQILYRLEISQDSTTTPVTGLEDLKSVVHQLRGGLTLLMDFAPVGRELMGLEERKRYLWLGQSADELRATGGFVSGAWLITLDSGEITDVRYHDAVLVDDWDRLALYPRAPDALEKHMNASVWLLRDVSWEPDFPTTARTAEDLFELGQRTKVDGVIALNQWFLLNVIDASGSVASPTENEQITSLNLLPSLEKGTDDHGRDYADLALQGILEKLSGSADISTLMRFGAAVFASLESRDLLLYMNHPNIQSIIEKNGWGGGIDREASDYLYVVDSNIGWSKSDRNIERRISYQIDLRREEGPRISLNLGYNNHSGPGSPGCFPQWRHRGTNYGELKNACLWNYWRVYVPQGATLRSNTALPLPELSVAVEIGKGESGEDTIEVSSNYGRTMFSGLLALSAGEDRDIGLVYDLPPTVLNRHSNEIEYELMIQKQPGVRERNVHIEFILPANHRLSSSSIIPVYESDSKVSFVTTLEEDLSLKAAFTHMGSE